MRGQCRATNKDGSPCQVEGHLIDPETGLCPTHRDPDHTREAGKKGGAATREAWGRQGLDPDELGPLEDYDDAERWLRVTGLAVATGRLRDRDGAVVVRAVQEWTRTRGDKLTHEVMGQLKRRVGELEAELKRSKVRAIK